MTTARLIIEPLTTGHVDALAALLLCDAVYEHIGGTPPTPEDLRLRIQRALAGPPPSRSGESWVNLVVRLRDGGAVLGRLEATVHGGIAEVAFLFGPAHWGRGYATEGLTWLNAQLLARPDCRALWATTVPANRRSQALLTRCGYALAADGWPARLTSYDPGDLVYRGPAAP